MEIEDDLEKIKVIYENIEIILQKEKERLYKDILLIEEEITNSNTKLNNIINKVENSFQQHELLYYELENIKNKIKNYSKQITNIYLQKLLNIKNPNELIFNLMKTFYIFINNNNIHNNNNNINSNEINNLTWEILQKKIKINLFHNYIVSITNNNNNEINKNDLDNAMHFFIDHSKLIEKLNNIGKDYIIILNFIKESIDFYIKLNLLQNLYKGSLNKNNKMNNIQSEIDNDKYIISKAESILNNLSNEINYINNYKQSNNNNINKNSNNINNNNKEKDIKFKSFVFQLIYKYKIKDKYHISHEFINNKEKYIIKLKTFYKDKKNFINHLIQSEIEYEINLSNNNFENNYNKEVTNFINSFENNNNNNINNNNFKSRNGFSYFRPKFFLSQNYKKIIKENKKVKSLTNNDNIFSYDSSDTKNSLSKSKIKNITFNNSININNNINNFNTIEVEKTTGRTKVNEKEDDKDISYNNSNLNSFRNNNNNKFINSRNKKNKGIIIENKKIEMDYFCCKSHD